MSAIRCHTTGKPGMSKLDKILYLADMTSAERDYPGVEPLRKLEFEDLDKAICAALEQSIQFVKDSGKPMDPESQAALDDARRQLAQRGRQTANPNLCENHQATPAARPRPMRTPAWRKPAPAPAPTPKRPACAAASSSRG